MKDALKNLSKFGKVHFVASVVLGVSVFFPWYSDLDSYGTGEMYLGIGGPTYLFGLLVGFSALVSTVLVWKKVNGKELPKLPVTFGRFQMILSVVAFSLLVLASSVLFNKNFGINVTKKEMGFGMFLAFISAGVQFVAAWFNAKNIVLNYGESMINKPLEEINLQDRKSKLSINKEATVEEAIAAYEQFKEYGER